MENSNTINTVSHGQKQRFEDHGLKGAKRDYDPILDDPISDGEPSGDSDDEGESGSDGSEEGIQIEFPRENGAELMTFLHREITNLQNMEDNQKRKFALLRLYEIFVLAETKAHKKVYQEILPQIQKLLFKRLSDKVEKCRELAALIIKEFFSRVDDLTLSIPYLMPVMLDRLNAEDLEGVDTLDEKMKPRPEQRAQVLAELPEDSEEIRVIMAEIMTLVVSATDWVCLRPYVDTLVAIFRALCMDPAGLVIIEGTLGMAALSRQAGDQLLHFCENMGRALFTAFVHKHAKVRIAGLKALFDVLVCGQWKTSVEVLQHMVGFRDPNIVPIKEFYDPTAKVNYFAMFVGDRSTIVRECFYKTIGDLLMRLPDKCDHEGRLFPYMISGLYDQNDDIKQICFEIIEELGQRYEEENEEKLRDIKQLAYKAEWLYDGVKDNQVSFPFPIAHRPRLGSRHLVRQYVRRYITGLYKEISDWLVASRERSSFLILYSVIYAEEYMTQFMDNLLVALYKTVLETENKIIMKNVPHVLKLLGRYVMPSHYRGLVMPAIKNELASFYSYTQSGAVRSLGYLFMGSTELIRDNYDNVQELLNDFIHYAKTELVMQLDMELAQLLVETIHRILQQLLDKQAKGVCPKALISDHLQDIFVISLKCLAVFQSFRLQSKPDPENIVQAKTQVQAIFAQLQALSENKDQDFLVKGLPPVIDSVFGVCHEEVVSSWSAQQPQFKLFFALVFMCSTEHLMMEVSEGVTIFDELCRICKGTLVMNPESKNIKMKQLGCFTVFPCLVNKVQARLDVNESDLLMGILEQAFQIDWGSRDENNKNHRLLATQHDELIKSGSIKLKSIEASNQFIKLMQTLSKIYKSRDATEQTLQQSVSTLRAYIKIMNDQLIQKIPTAAERYDQLSKTEFLPVMMDDLINFCTSYFDGVRDEACKCLLMIGENFLTHETSLNKDQMQMVHMLRANLTQGWNEQMTQPIKECAEMERDVSKFMFSDAFEYVHKMITVMLDEPSTRDLLSRFMIKINTAFPFLLMNDYRVALATNSLQRAELLKRILSQAQ